MNHTHISTWDNYLQDNLKSKKGTVPGLNNEWHKILCSGNVSEMGKRISHRILYMIIMYQDNSKQV